MVREQEEERLEAQSCHPLANEKVFVVDEIVNCQDGCILAKKGDVNKQVLRSKHARRLPSVDALKSKIEAVWYNVLSVDAVKMACKSFKDR